ncbi:histidinol phosphate phosphatase domain-containing protein [Alkalihalobacillus sp. BA299]|uniref:histidinol phosphate phosphatase domain-containing protein n=1 Tax=Alkalihalobacillus sp. BA299 TaxID=2815938 RepID=UPI001ADAA162|nr:histidinol phosphate phosphatase domain-containing protein [Alkalihalobacillus sp. BA299]
MKIDYHVHLEEGPYSTNWLARTATSLAFFQGKGLTASPHSIEWVKQITKQLNSRVEEGCYSEAWLDLYLERAKQLGLKEVGIVEHLYRFRDCLDYFKEHMHLEADSLGTLQNKWLHQVSTIPSMDHFIEFIHSQQEKWQKQGVNLALGLEADYFPNGEEKLKRLLENKPWDYVIGSVHFINGWGFDNKETAHYFEQMNLIELYQTHTSYVCQSIESKLFDMVAHLDNLKVFSYRPEETLLLENYQQVAETLKKNNIASEVNTGLSYRYPVKEACPSPSYLQVLANYQVPLTLSSDSHYPDDLGTNLDQATELLKNNHYTSVVGFSKRKRHAVEL